jgi:hypothetical protein
MNNNIIPIMGITSLLFIISFLNSLKVSKSQYWKILNFLLIITSIIFNIHIKKTIFIKNCDYLCIFLLAILCIPSKLIIILLLFSIFFYDLCYIKNVACLIMLYYVLNITYKTNKIHYNILLYTSLICFFIYSYRFYKRHTLPITHKLCLTFFWHLFTMIYLFIISFYM